MTISCGFLRAKREPLHKYKISISDLTFEAIIGILEKEREVAQCVVADVEIIYEKKSDTFINYAQVASLIESTMQKEKYLLLEEALEELSKKIKSEFSAITSINLKLSKPDILDNCVVGVEIFKNY